MNKQQRWNKIVELCTEYGRITSEEIAKALDISVVTARRDLQMMEELDMIERYHGGAFISDKQHQEPPMLLKSITNKNAKVNIAKYAASLIKDNMMIYLDAGSSTYEMIPYITAKNITIASIGIPQINRLIEKNVDVMVLGGVIRKSTSAITGMQTLKHLDDIYFDMAFLGTNAIHPIVGYSTTNDLEAAVKSKAMQRAAKTYILADDSKFNRISQSPFAKLNSATLITNDIKDFDKNLLDYIII